MGEVSEFLSDLSLGFILYFIENNLIKRKI